MLELLLRNFSSGISYTQYAVLIEIPTVPPPVTPCPRPKQPSQDPEEDEESENPTEREKERVPIERIVRTRHGSENKEEHGHYDRNQNKDRNSEQKPPHHAPSGSPIIVIIAHVHSILLMPLIHIASVR